MTTAANRVLAPIHAARHVQRWLAALILAALPSLALAAEPTAGRAADLTSKPIPRLNLGEEHSAAIVSISASKSNGRVLTVSEDKTARIFDLQSERLVSVIRPPQDNGTEGTLLAGALSPDGKLAAVGGITSGENKKISIPIFDVATGRLIRRVGSLDSAPVEIAFSADGRYLAIASTTLIFVDLRTAQQSTIDENSSYSRFASVHFSSDGKKLIATCMGNLFFGTCREGQVRLYENRSGRFKPLKLATPGGAREPTSARFSPDGKLIALGYEDAPVVDVLDAKTLGIVSRLALGDHREILDQLQKLKTLRSLHHVEWSEDGLKLHAAGNLRFPNNTSVRSWSSSDWSVATDSVITTRYITGLTALSNGSLLFSTAGAGWGVINPTGSEFRYVQSERPWSGFIGDSLRTSANGQTIGFISSAVDQRRFVFDMGMRGLQDSPLEYENLHAPLVTSPKFWKSKGDDVEYLVLIGRREDNLDKDGNEMYEFGKGLTSIRHHAFTQFDSDLVVLNQEGKLRLFSLQRKQSWIREVETPIRGINIPTEGRFVVVAHDDGTIRWYRLSDGQELLAFYLHRDGRRWIAWTPEGYFDASPGAEDLIGYHINRGRDREGEFVSARQLWETFYQPQLIARRLGADGDALLAEAVAKRGDVRELLAVKPPELELVSLTEDPSDGSYRLRVQARRLGQGKGRWVLRVDGQEQQAGRWQAPPLTPGGVVELPFDPANGSHELTAEYVDGRGIASLRVGGTVAVSRRAGEAATLHVLAVGVSKYRDGDLRRGVAFAAGDAEAVAARLAERGSLLPAFAGRVVARTLPDDKATVAGIERTLNEMLAKARPEDVFVLFMAGHGTTLDDEYYFMPWELEYENDAALRRQAISQERLRDWQKQMPARSLLLLDTCRSGNLVQLASRAGEDKTALAKLIRVSQRNVIVATSADRIALEGHEGHGVFTWAVLDALLNADYDKNGQVDVSDIAMHVRRWVPEITERKFGHRQTPMQDTPGQPFAVAQPAPPAR